MMHGPTDIKYANVFIPGIGIYQKQDYLVAPV